MKVEEKELEGGTLRIVTVHECKPPHPEQARRHGAGEFSTWQCGACAKIHRLVRQSDQREGVWWEWK